MQVQRKDAFAVSNASTRKSHLRGTGLRSRTFAGILCIGTFATLACAQDTRSTHKQESQLELTSSDTHLVDSFNWAKQQALAYVFNGDPVGPWYEASLPGRKAFCMRDVSHQAVGAHALGLSQYTHNMLRRFAENIAASRDWCSYWEINNQNLPAPVDYKSDQVFWYNLPANFDVLDTCYRMYLWTGDPSYIHDPVFLNFYSRTVTDYVSRWDLHPNHIMNRKNNATPPPFFRGDPSYEESRQDITLGVDLLAAQYAGYRSFAAIQAIRGNRNSAMLYLASASDVKSLINSTWWNSERGSFYAYLDANRQLQGHAGADVLYWDAADDGSRAQGALHDLLQDQRTQTPNAVEPESHYAEILYRYGAPEAAYNEIMDLSKPGRERREYPEVSFSVVGAIVTGLMGIQVKPSQSIQQIARNGRLSPVVQTLPRLTAKTAWVEIRNLPVESDWITVREVANDETVLINHGKKTLVWQATFPGRSATLIVNGKLIPAHLETHYLHLDVTWVQVPVPAGATVSVDCRNNRDRQQSGN